MSKAIYIHVPFCQSICAYCDFTHVVYQKKLVDDWLIALAQQIQYTQNDEPIQTIYLGGGTPTCLNHEQLETLFKLIDRFTQDCQEYTIEINPETFDLKKAKLLQQYGINRVSIGFQASQSHLLKMMLRQHTLEDVQKTITWCRQVGIENISLDLMYSLPNQTMDDLKESVANVLKLQPTHISLYSLTIEKNTVFDRLGYEPLNEQMEADMYEWIVKTLNQHGYHQYEVANFAKPGYASKHNQTYWLYEDFIGLSCGASGKENHVRYDMTKNIQEYIHQPLSKTLIHLRKEEEMFEMVMMNLRLTKGIECAHFERFFKESLMDIFQKPIEKHLKLGNLEYDQGYLRCTTQGLECLHSILVDFL